MTPVAVEPIDNRVDEQMLSDEVDDVAAGGHRRRREAQQYGQYADETQHPLLLLLNFGCCCSIEDNSSRLLRDELAGRIFDLLDLFIAVVAVVDNDANVLRLLLINGALNLFEKLIIKLLNLRF